MSSRKNWLSPRKSRSHFDPFQSWNIVVVIFVSIIKAVFDLRAGRHRPAAMAAFCGTTWLIGLMLFLSERSTG
jgi:uncharacterized membrane protein YhaH (DUF805 family)